jgi:cobalamin biosynthesis protein CobD/CbiB
MGRPKGDHIVFGGESRVDLLPPEVRVHRKAKSARRRLGFVVVLLVVLVLGGTALTRAMAIQARANLAIERANTQSLLKLQRKYAEVRKVQQQVELIQAAQQVGSAT